MMKERKLQGIGISPGVAIGRAYLLEVTKPIVWMHRIAPETLDEEIKRFRRAVELTKKSLLQLKGEIAEKIGMEHAYIFDAHMLMLEDPMLVQRVEENIRRERVNAEFALQQVISELSRTFRSFEDPYLRERGVDVLDVGNRLQLSLCRPIDRVERAPREPSIIVAHEIAPSKLASLDSSLLLGMVMDVGGQTTHTGLLARSQGIPAVVGLRDLSAQLKGGETLVVDGGQGIVVINPSEETLDRYRERRRRFSRRDAELQSSRDLSAVTVDGFEMTMLANVEMAEEMGPAIRYGAKGVGLYRTEFVFLRNPRLLPTEEEHERLYSEMAEAASPYFVNVRTMDFGGEKGLESLGMETEPNPALGLRAVRFSLQHTAIFKTQLRGILRAAVHGDLRILVPMITSVIELRQVKELLEQCKEELRSEGLPLKEGIAVGAMIEVPSAALTADTIASEADFIQVGTNDLIQYILGIDRSNTAVAYLYDPFNPAVIRLLAEVCERVHKVGKRVGMCGEMAADPLAVPVLVGLGYDELSMNAVSIPVIKSIIRALDRKHCRAIAREAIGLSSHWEVRNHLAAAFEKQYPNLLKCELDPLGEMR